MSETAKDQPDRPCEVALWSCTVELPFFLALPEGYGASVLLGNPEKRSQLGSVSLFVVNGWDGFAAFRDRRLVTKQYAPPSEANSAIARLVTVEPGAVIYRWPARTLVRSGHFVEMELPQNRTITQDERDLALRVFFDALNRLLLVYSFYAPLDLAAQVEMVTPDTVAGISLTVECKHEVAHLPASSWVYAQFEAPKPVPEDVVNSISKFVKLGGPGSISVQRLVRARRAGAMGDFGAMLLLAWSAVEVTLRGIGEALGLPGEEIKNAERLVNRVISELDRRGEPLERATRDQLHAVRKLRNTFIHAGLEPDTEAARHVYKICGNAALELGRRARAIGLVDPRQQSWDDRRLGASE